MSKSKSKPVPHMVEMIVGRCHVGQSNRAVIRYFISRLKHGYRTWIALPKAERKQWLQWVIQAHQANGSLYTYVMRGCR
jgi:hypothetical protein